MIVKNVEKKEKNSVQFQVEVTPDEFEEAVQDAYLKNKKSIAVPGFRKGKAPRMVIEGMYGADVFHNDAIEELSPKAFNFGVEAENLKAVGRPTCTDAEVTDEKALLITYETGIYPEVTLGQYKGLEVPKEEINITDADVDKYLAEMQKRNGRQITVDRPAKLGDTVDIDYEGFKDGVAFEGGKDEGHKLELGSGSFIPGFEDQLVGVSAGEEKDINLTFPEDYHAEDLAGQAVVFKVKVNEVIEIELPEIDDEFAKDVSEFSSLDEYRGSIKEELVKARTKAVDEDFAFAAVEKAVENMTVEVPDSMIEEQLERLYQEYDRSLMAQGMRLEAYMQMMGMNPDSFAAMLRPQAEAQVKTDLLLTAVAKEENIEVSDEELDKAVEDIAKSYNTTVEVITKGIPKEAMIEDMQKKKANDMIVESAVAVAKPAEEEKKEDEPAAPKKKAPAKKKAAESAEGEEEAEAKPKRTRKKAEKTEDTAEKEAGDKAE